MSKEIKALAARVEEQAETVVELRELLDTTPDALVVIDESGRIELVNQQAERLFGYAREELLGSSIEQLLPERFRSAHGKHRDHFANKPHVRPMGAGLDLFGLTRDGREIPVEISLSPIRLNNRVLFASAIRDITARVEIETRLRQARDAADRATEDKARFIAAASHDLRQPLQAAAIYLDLATNETVSAGQRSEAIDKTQRCVETLTGLLNKIMHVSKLDAAAVTPHPSDFAVTTVFDRLREQYAPAAVEKGLELRVVPSSAIVRSDPILLQQLVENLVSNALRYTEHGGVLLGCRRRGSDVVVQVWDTGVGIADDDQEEIFEEFRRLGGKSADANLGMGLGLAIVRRLEQLLGHPVRLHSRVGKGTVFEVVVPRSRRPSDEVAPVTETRQIVGHQGLIAVVEDDQEVRTAISTVLEVSGYGVLAAESLAQLGEELTRRDCVPDMILTDYRLGARGTGLDVIGEVRRRFQARLPAVVLTGDSSFSLLEKKASELDFVLLAKPVDTAQLLEVLARGLAATERESP